MSFGGCCRWWLANSNVFAAADDTRCERGTSITEEDARFLVVQSEEGRGRLEEAERRMMAEGDHQFLTKPDDFAIGQRVAATYARSQEVARFRSSVSADNECKQDADSAAGGATPCLSQVGAEQLRRREAELQKEEELRALAGEPGYVT